MCPLNDVSRLQCSLAGFEALSARARAGMVADHVGAALPQGAALFATDPVVTEVSADVLGATLGEGAVELVDPMSTPRSPTRKDISAVSFVGKEETSTNCEIPTCQKLGAAHRCLRRVRSQRETYGGGENARSDFGIASRRGGQRRLARRRPAFDGGKRVAALMFCLPTSLRSTFECA
jgi:hypothetical protein